MPETGNNIQASKKILSIRLSTGGLSFWTATADGVWPGNALITGLSRETVIPFVKQRPVGDSIGNALKMIEKEVAGYGDLDKIVFLDTPKTLLIPAEIFDPDKTEEYISFHGIACGPTERTDISPAIHGTVAIMVSPDEQIRLLREKSGGCTLVSSLQYNLMLPAPRVKVKAGKTSCYIAAYITPSRCYISILDTGGESRRMLYCDHFPYAGHADLLYYLSVIGRKFPLNAKTPILLQGEGAQAAGKNLRKFHNVL